MAKLFKIQTYLLDYNDDFRDEQFLKDYLELQIRYGHLDHTHIMSTKIDEWDDNHPLNYTDCPEAEYEKYFKENKQ